VALSGTKAPNYTVSQPTGLTANITTAAITASIIGNPTKTYDGTTTATLTPANFSLTGVATGDSFTVTQTVGAYNSKDVATANTVTASLSAGNFSPGSGTSASNYTFPASATGAGQITKANATVVVAPYNVTYDGQSHTATVTSITGVNGETGTMVGTVHLPPGHVAAGTYNDPLEIWTFTGTANYNDIGATQLTDIINKANATWATNPSSKTYGAAEPNPLTTGSGTGFASGDAAVLTVTYSRVSGETVLGGPYHITATLGPADVIANYNITNAGAAFTITAKDATWTTQP